MLSLAKNLFFVCFVPFVVKKIKPRGCEVYEERQNMIDIDYINMN